MKLVIGMNHLFMFRDKDVLLTKLLAKYMDDLVMVTSSESMFD